MSEYCRDCARLSEECELLSKANNEAMDRIAQLESAVIKLLQCDCSDCKAEARALLETALETPVSTLCAICDQIKELHPSTHPWTARETACVTGHIGTGGKRPEPPKEHRCAICGGDTREIGHGHGGGSP